MDSTDPGEPPNPEPQLEPSGSEAPPPPVHPPPPAPVPAVATDPAPAEAAEPSPMPAPAPAPAPAPPSAVWSAVSLPPAEANGGSDRKKKRKADEGEGCRTCSCKKSRCLKLYCVCFASGSHCSELCGCEPCYNKPIHGVPRNTPALPLKVVQTAEAGQDLAEQLIRSPMDLVRRKCTCKKSGCLKKYCDCYQGGAGCSINCRCDDCKNPYGRKVGVILDGKSMLPSPTPNERNGTEADSSDDDDDEDDYYMNRPLSPIPPSPVSRESSFQQETLVGVEVHTMNGHLYPKPLTQVRPESWQLSRRPTEEPRGEPWRYLRRPSEDGTSDVMEGHAEPKFQRDNSNKQPESHLDRFSIPRCIEVMNAMEDLSPIDKSLAPDIFLDASNREIFLSLSVDIRTMWLKRKMRNLV
ncbi:hypothetical protein BRADI_4g02410v3 [Brachypodium distachyon]|uniref:CRC domain-containing protein n=1 Tax=Brachypodium distachyon TaxID=15368 RepID=I1IGP0_BRADI|nr:hypothetical protein BRADI_4g02410v3 [Brachypodium distachyon]